MKMIDFGTSKIINVIKWDGTQEMVEIDIPPSSARNPDRYITELLDDLADIVMTWDYIEVPYYHRKGDPLI